MNHINLQSVYDDIIMTVEIRSAVHYVLWCSNVLSMHMYMQGMDWNIITSAAEALNCTIILLRHTAGPAALDLKASWGSPQWLVLPLYKTILDRHQAAFLYNAQQRQCTDLMTARSPDLRGTLVGKWLLYWGWASWDHPHTHSDEGKHAQRCHGPVVGKQRYNMTISCHPRLLSSPVTLVTVWETKKHMTMERVTACDSQPCCCSTSQAEVESN